MDDFLAHASGSLAAYDGDERLAGVDFVIEQRIGTEPPWESHYHVVIGSGSIRVEDGPADSPDVTITQDPETAAALQRGDLHAQNAFLTGRLSIDGDIGRLIEHGELLGRLVDGPR